MLQEGAAVGNATSWVTIEIRLGLREDREGFSIIELSPFNRPAVKHDPIFLKRLPSDALVVRDAAHVQRQDLR